MNNCRSLPLLALIAATISPLSAQENRPGTANATPTPARGPVRAEPKYPIPYPPASVAEIRSVLERVHGYLNQVTPFGVIEGGSGKKITDFSTPNRRAELVRGEFQIVSYEWGVTYAGMLHAGEATGDARYKDYVGERLRFIADAVKVFDYEEQRPSPSPSPSASPSPGRRGRDRWRVTLNRVARPQTLDDSGAMGAAMIKAQRLGVGGDLRPRIDNYLQWISTKQFRLSDGTLARNRPLPDTLWLDDLYMSVPALAQMGALTGETKYFDDAVKQVLRFSERMFVKEKGLYMHGWVQAMDVHPVFHWARANGWAIVAMTELLEVLPEDHPGREQVLMQYRDHVRGLMSYQSGDGLWHQVLDRPDSYLETSASAMFVYSIARGINRGWLNALSYGPTVLVGWNAVAQKVNKRGEVEGTCVGTGMSFEPTFYYYRPTSVRAAHGYGPVLHAGAEMIAFREGKGKEAVVGRDRAIEVVPPPKSGPGR